MSLIINNHYNFSLHTNTSLGVTYTNCRLVSILDYQTALRFANVVQLHRQIYPYLPSGTVEDQTRYSYYLFNDNGKNVVIADVWIINSSIELSAGSVYKLKLMNVTSSQLTLIRDQLRVLGVSFTVE